MTTDETTEQTEAQTNNGEVSEETESQETVTEEQAEEKEDYRGKLNATNRFLEKEGYKFQDGRWVKPQAPVVQRKEVAQTHQSGDGLSPKDLYALTAAQVHIDDFDEVVKAAKLLGKPIADAVKDPVVKGILAGRAEERKTAEATSTKPARPSQKKPDANEILRKASQGEIPQKGSNEAEELFWARRGGRPK